MKRLLCWQVLAAPIMAASISVWGQLGFQPPSPPSIGSIAVTGGQARICFLPYPAAMEYQILSGADLGRPLTQDFSGWFSGFAWQAPATNGQRYYRLEVLPMASKALLTATVLNRLAYGPTPDELERLLTGTNAIGPQAYIEEQLAPWNLTENAEQVAPTIADLGALMAAPNEEVTPYHAGYVDLVAWHTLRAVNARAQLLEILLQFFENHFVTRYEKSLAFLFNVYGDQACTYCLLMDRLAAQFEYLENRKWRAALINPQCTFYDLLRISAESPAMIIYLDTVSNGNDGPIPNENYARELLELFTFGVDNGYDQSDIEAVAPAWMGWRVDKVAPEDYDNPFATPLVLQGEPYTNSVGVWAFVYDGIYHDNTNAKTIFAGKKVAARFGSPWTDRAYQLDLPARSGQDGIQDGYDVIRHLADQPFTMEYISVKLCRVFVHDNFPTPSTRPGTPGYDFYDYTRPDLSPEAELVHDCMVTWQNTQPTGQIWPVLATIFNSGLFRSYRTAQQKIKTPLELCISAVRALRSSRDGSGSPDSFTAGSDGYSFQGPLIDLGNMPLFDRLTPDGYPEAGRAWISAGTVMARTRFAQSLCLPPGFLGKNIAGLGHYLEPVALLSAKLPQDRLNDAASVADYLLSIVYPGEGKANLSPYRDLLVQRLNDGGTDSPPSVMLLSEVPFSAVYGSAYDTRIRAAVALLLSWQPFQEQ